NLNGGTLFNAEFGIRHRAAPYRKGQVLHSVFAAATSFMILFLNFKLLPLWRFVGIEALLSKLLRVQNLVNK
ncbi:hypothetical protein, partial [Stutzerimonas frequens]|uniref:hypothetical protein n=1 Tax=Stutzerimonas frequens TaxID=2968969 RepID=UPI001F3ED429